MDVRIAFTIKIDPEMWELNYGTIRNQTRNDVKHYAESVVREQFDSVGVLA